MERKWLELSFSPGTWGDRPVETVRCTVSHAVSVRGSPACAFHAIGHANPVERERAVQC
jgi:hypothetical protein